MYKVLDVCRHVINYSNDQDYGISNLKLQKILYFIQAVFLVTQPKKCFEETIEAWDFGPVVPEAYREYKLYGSGNIPMITRFIEINKDNIWDSLVKEYKDDVISQNHKELIDAVVDKFADYSATDLVTITHRQAPWKDSYVRGKNNEITTTAIKEYFDGRRN